jgi:RNA polymerase sigma-70 factor (ECF subfamily)
MAKQSGRILKTAIRAQGRWRTRAMGRAEQVGVMASLTSHELLRRYRQGDDQAAEAIFDRYVARLIALARGRIGPKLRRRIDPEDVVQSAYRSFFAHAANDEYVLRRAGDLWRLLASITLHKLHGQVEWHTAGRRDIRKEASLEANVSAANRTTPEPTPQEAAALIELLERVTNQLEANERTVLIARLQGRTIEEIGVEMERSHRTVRRLLAQAKLRIEDAFLERPPREAP